MPRRPAVAAVFFDVDFTLIYPGPTFQGEGYQGPKGKYPLAIALTLANPRDPAAPLPPYCSKYKGYLQ